MTEDNPYNPYEASKETHLFANEPPSIGLKFAGGVVLLIGIILLGYGAAAFWWKPTLPPNNREFGRLPSVYVMGGGIAVSLIGLVMRTLGRGKSSQVAVQSKNQTSVFGILLLVAILIGAFVYIALM
jgi:hypothetical protein